MLRIGDFSKLSRISIRMLRHYNEIGILVPDAVDDFTGYRYYNEAQLPLAGRIQALKNLGFSLAIIKELLDKYEDASEMERFLLARRREIEGQEMIIRQRIRLIDSTIQWLRKDGKIMGYDVSLKTMPELYAGSVRKVIPTYADEGLLWKIFAEETVPLKVEYSNPCYAMAVYYDGEYKENEVDVEIRQSVTGCYPDTEHVKFKKIPPVQIASATFKGGYEQIAQVNAAAASWIKDNGYDYDGFAFNIYHVGPADTKNPDEYVTEVCYPVKKK